MQEAAEEVELEEAAVRLALRRTRSRLKAAADRSATFWSHAQRQVAEDRLRLAAQQQLQITVVVVCHVSHQKLPSRDRDMPPE